MMYQIRWEIVHRIFHLNFEQFDAHEIEQKRRHELEELNLSGTGDSVSESSEPVKRDAPKVGRNDDCPCGSGKKYKKCCG